MKTRVLWGIILGVALGLPAFGSQAAGEPSRSSDPAPAASQPANRQSRPGSSANQRKRRDPFGSLVPTKKSKAPAIPVQLPPGKKGLVIEQMQLQGIVRDIEGNWIAVVDNKSKRAYFLHEKDEVYNGVVSKITADSVVFQETSPNALGKAASREVVKRLPAQ